ncbi:hypothetical protein KY289_030540 [Solanum tuberosum]|nr:hypothetical protein KY289_030540 [Solanum tuberosum]
MTLIRQPGAKPHERDHKLLAGGRSTVRAQCSGVGSDSTKVECLVEGLVHSSGEVEGRIKQLRQDIIVVSLLHCIRLAPY